MKRGAFDRLVRSVRQAGRIRRGRAKASRTFVFAPADVKAIRGKLGKSQSEFALMIGVSVATLRNWEQGRRTPEGPALALLRVASVDPKAVARALRGAAYLPANDRRVGKEAAPLAAELGVRNTLEPGRGVEGAEGAVKPTRPSRSRPRRARPQASETPLARRDEPVHRAPTSLQPAGRPVPRGVAAWKREILEAYADARSAVPLMSRRDQAAGERVLFHLAPHVAMKFRGTPERERNRVVKAALASYVASQRTASAELKNPLVAFAFTYCAANFALDMIAADEVERLMDAVELSLARGRA